jgi:signal transduction histidine kinase/PAS domain-containing protein
VLPFDDPRLLQGVIDAARLLIVVVDETGHVQLVNHAVERATGWSPAAWRRPIWELAEFSTERDLLYAAFNPLDIASFPSGLMFHLHSAGESPRIVDWDVRVVETEHGASNMVFTGVDVTERAAVQERLRETEAFQRDILDRLPAIVWTTDTDLRTTFSAGGGLAWLGLKSGEVALLGSSVASYFQTSDPDHPGIAAHTRALAGESTVMELSWFDRHFQSRLEPLRDHQGRIVGVVGLSFDVTELTRTAQARDLLLVKEQNARMEIEVANTRLQLLVDGSARLSRAMSPNDVIETLARLVIPGLGDWSYILHRGWNGGPPLVAAAHGEPNRQPLLAGLGACSPDGAGPEGMARVFRTGEIAAYEDVTIDHLSPDAPGGGLFGVRDVEQVSALQALGVRSLLCVPITGRHGVDAVMMLVSSTNPRWYVPGDLLLAGDLAGRAAISLENGRLLFEALEAVRARDDFLAVAAHELRTPLTSLLLQIQRLQRAIARDRFDLVAINRGVEAVESQARRLSDLVDGLLDVSRVASDRLGVHLEEFDLRELVDGVVAAMAPAFQRAGSQVIITAPVQATVRWDRGRIEQVLTNLLGNAIKFGAGQPIELRASVTGTRAEISVRDHGIGISHEDQARIFGRFERAVSTRHFGGLGLGLYISAQILRTHQGSLRVESEPGQGACFIVDLPRGLQPSVAATEHPHGP